MRFRTSKTRASGKKTPKKRTKKWYKEVKTWGVNEAKWKSATKWCEDNNMQFQILNEDHLEIRYK